LIKRAAAAGAVAWTAPMILDSLASPAAAAISCSACYKFEIPLVDTGKATPTNADSYNEYASLTCTAPNDNSCTDVGASKPTLSSLGATTAGTFSTDAAQGTQATVSFSASSVKVGTFSCTGPITLLGTSFVWRTTDCTNGNITSGKNFCTSAAPGGSDTVAAGVGIVAVTTTSATFGMPGDGACASFGTHGKPGHSGAFNFIVGCSCV